MRPDARWPVSGWLAAALVLLAPPAYAHEAVTGVTGFAALVLHPLIVPEQLLLLVAASLIAGRMTEGGFASAVFALMAGLLAGKAGHLAVPWLSMFWYAPFVLVLLGGLAVAGLRSFAPRTGALAVFAFGFVFSVGIVPDQPTELGLARAIGAAMIAGAAVLLAVGWPLARVSSGWGGVAIRVAGAWLAAIALINLALAVRLMSQGA